LLQAADVVAGYPGRPPVLHQVTLEIPAGGLVGILGPNGSGKTTLLRAFAGVIRPSQGQVRLDGKNLGDVPKRWLAQRMAVVPQETHLAFDYSVLEVVLMGRHAHLSTLELEGPGDFAIARGAMAATGTLSLQNRPFDTLSGGEKQRVIVAAALAQISGAKNDGILLLDEPTVALDLAYQLELAELLREWHRHVAMTIVVSTHDLNFAANLCQSLVLLKDGRVLAAGATGDVLTSEQIRRLYDVEADVSRHASTGRMVVVPLRRALAQPRS
jgi:ABC-type cobalamin/Fe3+-siderophores transport system ATPase subunit